MKSFNFTIASIGVFLLIFSQTLAFVHALPDPKTVSLLVLSTGAFDPPELYFKADNRVDDADPNTQFLPIPAYRESSGTPASIPLSPSGTLDLFKKISASSDNEDSWKQEETLHFTAGATSAVLAFFLDEKGNQQKKLVTSDAELKAGQIRVVNLTNHKAAIQVDGRSFSVDAGQTFTLPVSFGIDESFTYQAAWDLGGMGIATTGKKRLSFPAPGINLTVFLAWSTKTDGSEDRVEETVVPRDTRIYSRVEP